MKTYIVSEISSVVGCYTEEEFKTTEFRAVFSTQKEALDFMSNGPFKDRELELSIVKMDDRWEHFIAL